MEVNLGQKAEQLNNKAKMIQVDNKKQKWIGYNLRDADSSLSPKNQELEGAYRQIQKLDKLWKLTIKAKKETREAFKARVESLQVELKNT